MIVIRDLVKEMQAEAYERGRQAGALAMREAAAKVVENDGERITREDDDGIGVFEASQISAAHIRSIDPATLKGEE